MDTLKTVLCFLTLSLSLCQVQGKCGGNLTDTTGNFSSPAELGPNTTCTWYIVANASTTKQVMLSFTEFMIPAGGDNLTVFAGNATNSSIIANYTSHEGSVWMISPSSVTKIVLTRGPLTNVSAKFSASYDTKDCTMNMQGPEAVITSPVYLNGTKGFTCTYIVTMDTKDIPILSFSNFTLPAGYLLTQWNNDKKVNHTGSSLPDDMFGVKDTTTLTLTLTIQKNTAKQQFMASSHAVSSQCSGQFTIDPTKASAFPLPSANQWPVSCYAQIVAPSNKTVSLTTETGSLLQAVDSVQYVDGGSRNGVALGNGNDGLPWHVSSSNKMTIIGTFGATKSQRVPLAYEASGSSKYYVVKKGTPQLLVTKQNGSWQFQGPAYFQMKLTLDATTSLTKGFLLIQDDKLQNLFLFKAGTAVTIPVLSPGTLLLVQAGNMSTDDTVSMHVEATTNDCNALFTADSGNINFMGPSGQNMCFLTVNSEKALSVQVNMLNLCENTTLEVYAGSMKTSPKLATLDSSSTSLPPMYFKAGSPPRFIWKNAGGNCSGPLLSARYWTTDKLCGGNVTAGNLTTQVLTSPWFPNQYPINSMCNWTVPSSNNSFLYLSLNTIQLGTNDSLQVMQNSTTMLAKFNGSQLTDDVIIANTNLSVTFTSNHTNNLGDLKNPGQGVSVTAFIIPCGGLVSKNASNITIPTNMTQSSQCIWILEVAKNGTNNSVNILNVTINLQGFNSSGYALEIYDGGSLREPMVKLNKSSKNSFLSRNNKLVIRYTNTTKMSAGQLQAPAFNFTLNYSTHNCNKTSLCGNGICMHPEWRCNGVNDCGDFSDEKNCGFTPIPTTPPPSPVPHTGGASPIGVKGYWVAIALFIGVALGVIFTVVVPKMIMKFRARSYNANSNYGSLHEDA